MWWEQRWLRPATGVWCPRRSLTAAGSYGDAPGGGVSKLDAVGGAPKGAETSHQSAGRHVVACHRDGLETAGNLAADGRGAVSSGSQLGGAHGLMRPRPVQNRNARQRPTPFDPGLAARARMVPKWRWWGRSVLLLCKIFAATGISGYGVVVSIGRCTCMDLVVLCLPGVVAEAATRRRNN